MQTRTGQRRLHECEHGGSYVFGERHHGRSLFFFLAVSLFAVVVTVVFVCARPPLVLQDLVRLFLGGWEPRRAAHLAHCRHSGRVRWIAPFGVLSSLAWVFSPLWPGPCPTRRGHPALPRCCRVVVVLGALWAVVDQVRPLVARLSVTVHYRVGVLVM